MVGPYYLLKENRQEIDVVGVFGYTMFHVTNFRIQGDAFNFLKSIPEISS